MKHLLCLLLVFLGTPAPSWGYIDSTPTLGKLIADADHIVVLQVAKVSRDKQVIIFNRIADLKGKNSAAVVKHKLTDGLHPRQPRFILDWAVSGFARYRVYPGRPAAELRRSAAHR